MDESVQQQILARLTELEARIEQLEERAPSCAFLREEKRIIDKIVHLTTENIGRAMGSHGPPPPPPRHRHEREGHRDRDDRGDHDRYRR